MAVPPDVIFASSDGPLPTYYGDVREMDDAKRLSALNRRLDEWLIEQIDELGKDEGAESKVYSPFPLALLTCVAMETLGSVMYHDDSESDEENARNGFRKVAAKMHQGFARSFSKKAKANIAERWADTKDTSKLRTPADLLYTYFRNTLIHRYQGQGVQITEEITKTYELTEEGTIAVDPYWLWRKFKQAYETLFQELHSNQEPTNARRTSALHYVEQLLA